LAARHGGNDADLVALLQRSLDPLEEAHVFAVDVDVDEAPQVALLVAEPLLQPGVRRVELRDALGQHAAVALHDVLVLRQPPQRRRDLDGNAHLLRSLPPIAGLGRLTNGPREAVGPAFRDRLPCGCRSALYDVALDRVDAHALLLRPVEAALDLTRIALQ